MEDELYKEHILHHYRNPRNKRVLVDADAKGMEVNALCGDDVTLYYKYDEQGVVTDMTFMGNGCAISQAAVSLLTDFAVGHRICDIAAYTARDMEALLGIPVSVTRARCAMLAIEAIKNSIV